MTEEVYIKAQSLKSRIKQLERIINILESNSSKYSDKVIIRVRLDYEDGNYLELGGNHIKKLKSVDDFKRELLILETDFSNL